MELKIETLARPHLLKLVPYTSARSEFSGQAGVWLDANENPIGSPTPRPFNRYPDPYHKALKARLQELKHVAPERIFLGNGSDEPIDLLIRIFCTPGQDAVCIQPPTYGMYEVCANISDVGIINVPLTPETFVPDVPALREKAFGKAKLLFLCNPNNPTANALRPEEILPLVADFPGLVVVDEAYGDFCPHLSLLPHLEKHPNLVVLQTLSKAWGLAGLRCGMAFGHPEVIGLMHKVKYPYNLNLFTQEAALEGLAQPEVKDRHVATLLAERAKLEAALPQVAGIIKVYPSEANFLLVRFEDARGTYAKLLEHGVVVRDRSKQLHLENCLRITIGTPEENRRLVETLCEIGGSPDSELAEYHWPTPTLLGRKASVRRKTKETDILVSLNLDGTGQSEIRTGLGFFDHMLDQLARHGGLDLEVLVTGDLHIDEHHTIEDTALALGEAFVKALGDKRGIERYGFLLPMDDCLAQVAIDFGGRPWLVWKADFHRERVGEMPTEMFQHFFKSFSDSARCNLNIQAEGENEHHKIEAIFKGWARAIKMAVRVDERQADILPSTKGAL